MTDTSPQPTEIIGGVDTHQDLHTAAIVSLDGAVLGTESFSTTRAGYRAMLRYRDPAVATKLALKYLARRIFDLNDEIAELDRFIGPLVEELAPNLLQLEGVGTEIAGELVVAAGENPDRLRCEASFAMMCGACPIPASSGKTQRHRLNRGGNRQANSALHLVVICRMRIDERTRAYVERRTRQGLSKREVIRCLKRYVAREIYKPLTTPSST